MQVRDRIKELRRVPAAELRPNPRNWRSHPDRQRQVLAGVLGEIGYADALLARELPDGSLMLVDGHLRAETTPDSVVPVLVLDVDEAEADQILLMLDPLAGLAGVAEERLAALLADVRPRSDIVEKLLSSADRGAEVPLPTARDAWPAVEEAACAGTDEALGSTASPDASPRRKAKPREQPAVEAAEVYQVIVECRDEADQRTVYEQMREEGYRCRVLTL